MLHRRQRKERLAFCKCALLHTPSGPTQTKYMSCVKVCCRLCSFNTFIVDRRQINRYRELRRWPSCTSTFSCSPTSQEVLAWPGRAGVWENFGPLLYFTAPKGSWEQNVGDGPQQVVHTGGGEGRAEDHDDSWWQQAQCCVIMNKSHIRTRKDH